MATQTKTALKALFETGDTLLQTSFVDLVDTMLAEGGSSGSYSDAMQTTNGIASANAAWQIGAGTNDVGTSLRIRSGIRLHGVVGVPAAAESGDFWLESDGFFYFRSLGTTYYIGQWRGGFTPPA